MDKKHELQIFESAEFGKVRTIVIDGEPWLVGKDVAEILGYTNSRKAIADHVDDEDKGVTKCDTLGGMQDLTVINESGFYSLVMGSKLPAAKRIKRWVTSEVLPSIRKTGSYSVGKTLPNGNDRAKRDEAMLYNARARAGKLLRDLAAMTDMPNYKEILLAKAANITTGEETLPMPKADSRKTYTAEQLCPMIKRPKTWRGQLGKVLKQNGMEQVADNGYFTRDEVNGHECKTFNWYADIILPKLAELFPNEYAAI